MSSIQALLSLFGFCPLLSKKCQAERTIDVFLHQAHLGQRVRSSRHRRRNKVDDEYMLVGIWHSRDGYALRRSLQLIEVSLAADIRRDHPTGLKIDRVPILAGIGAKLDENRRKAYMGRHFVVSFNDFVYCHLEDRRTSFIFESGMNPA